MEQQESYTPSVDYVDNDYQMEILLTRPAYASSLSVETRDKLVKELNREVSAEGRTTITVEHLNALLGIYTQDLRLGNLTGADYQYCHDGLDLAADLLSYGYASACVVMLTRVISRLELSQSRRGFLRKMRNTLIKNESARILEPPKNRTSMFGKKKEEYE